MLYKWKKAENIPLKYTMFVMWTTLFVYLFGPIKWIESWDYAEMLTILLLVLFFSAFAVGYYLRGKSFPKVPQNQQSLAHSIDWTRILSVTIWINFVLTIGNTLLYADVTNISELLNKVVVGLTSTGEAYYSKNVSSRSGELIVWITFLYSPILYLTNVLALFRFRSLKQVQKCCVIATLLIEAMRWVSIGTNKGLMDIVLLILTIYMINKMLYYGKESEHTKKRQRMNRWMTIGVLVLVILFLSFFGMAISSRIEGAYDVSNYDSFPYNLVPEGLRFLMDKVDSYLVQGYNNMEKIIENCEFRWTYGAGNSRFLMDALEKLGIFLEERTYPYQLAQYNVDPLASWHSAYAWFASDLTFVGVIFLMFVAGHYMCGLARDVITKEDPIAMALLYLMIMMVTNASCTNYVLAYTNGFWGFWGLVLFRIIQKRRVKFSIRNRS